MISEIDRLFTAACVTASEGVVIESESDLDPRKTRNRESLGRATVSDRDRIAERLFVTESLGRVMESEIDRYAPKVRETASVGRVTVSEIDREDP